MNIPDELLASYLDGELGAADHAAVAAAIAADPQLARAVAAQQALRARLRQAFDRTLDEPVPQRLRDAVQGPAIVDLPGAKPRRRGMRPGAMAWFAAAASLVVAVLVLPRLLRLAHEEPNFVAASPNRIAGGELAEALSQRLAAEQPSGRVRPGISFVAKSGEYCRTFIVAQDRRAVAGLACRDQETWRIPVLESIEATAGRRGDYRQATSALPPQVLQAVESRIAGEPLDAAGEARARDRDWRRTSAGGNRP